MEKQKSFLYAGIEFTPAYNLITTENRMHCLGVASNAENLLAKKDYSHSSFYEEAKKVSNWKRTDLFACKYGYFFPCNYPFFIFSAEFGEIPQNAERFEHETPFFECENEE